MPKTPITKVKISISIDGSILATLKKKANDNNLKLSQQINIELKKVLATDITYMAYELKMCMQEAEIWRFKIRRQKVDKEAEIIHNEPRH